MFDTSSKKCFDNGGTKYTFDTWGPVSYITGMGKYLHKKSCTKYKILSQMRLPFPRLISFLSLGIVPLQPEDQYADLGPLGNFSIAGFEMVLTRYVSTYIITYYLPSGQIKYRYKKVTN